MTQTIKIKKVLVGRGNTEVSATYTGVLGEITLDTDLNTLRVHNGTTVGGTRLATYAELEDVATGGLDLTGYVTTSNLAITNANVTAANLSIAGLRANIIAANAVVSSLSANIGAFHAYANATFTGGGSNTYSNTNVAAYLVANPQSGTYSNTNVQSYLGANVGAYQVWANAHFGTSTYGDSNVQSYLGANLGAYQSWANATLTTLSTISNASTQQTAIDSINANVTAANAAIVTANTGMKSYVDAVTTAWTSNAGTQATQINLLNANVTAANGAIVTANTGMKSYVDAVTTAWTSNAGTQATEINALRANITAANASIAAVTTAWTANAGTQATEINELRANITAANAQVYSDVNVAAYLAGDVTIGNLTTSGLLTTDLEIQSSLIKLRSGAANDEINISPDPEGWAFLQLPNNATATLFDTRLVNAAGNVTIETGDLASGSNSYTWKFGTDGTLKLPGNPGSISSDATSITLYSDADELNGMLFYETGAEIYAKQDFAIFTDNANNGHIWRFYADGNLQLPADGAINYANGVSILASVGGLYGNTEVAAYLLENPQPGTYGDTEVELYIGANIGAYQVYANANAAAQSIAIDSKAPTASPVFTETVTALGNISAQGNVTVSDNMTVLGNLSVQGTTTTVNATTLTLSDKIITVADGSTNNNEANEAGIYIPGSSANILYTSVDDSWTLNKTISGTGNIKAASWVIGSVFAFANGVNILTELYSNAATQATSINTINANLGAYQTYANSNAATQATSINTINANLGAYQTYANSNAATQATSITTLTTNAATQQTSINTINANLGAYQTYANSTSYSNANVTAYLPIHSGNIGASYITATGNVTAAAIITVGTYGNITGANIISANTFVFGANGVNILTELYSDIANIDANIGEFQSYANNTFGTGNIGFNDLVMYSLTGLSVNNSDLGHGATAGVDIPTNGSGDIVVTNGYGNVTVNAGVDFPSLKSWTFGNDGNLLVPGSVLPTIDNVYDLGSATNRFRHLYVGPGTVYVGNAAIKTTATGNLILPGLTRAIASSAYVEEVQDRGDQTHVFNSVPTVIDNAQYQNLVNPTYDFTPATYEVDQLDGDGYIDGITVTDGGIGYADAVAALAEQNMWATETANPINNFNAGNWTRIPFYAQSRAGESEFEFSTGDGGADTGDIRFDNSMIYSNNGDSMLLDPAADEDDTGRIHIPGPSDADTNPIWLENQRAGGVKVSVDRNSHWYFRADGNLQLPTSGGIVDSNGNNVLTGSGGGSFDQNLNTTDDVEFNSVGTGLVNFGQTGITSLGAPSNDGSTDRLRLWDFDGGNDSGFNYAIGVEESHMWFTMDVDSDAGGFKFYSQDNAVLTIGGAGTLTLGADSTGIFWNNGAAYSSGTSSSAPVSIDNDAPSGTAGQLWYNTDDGRLYVYADSEWADASPQVPTELGTVDQLVFENDNYIEGGMANLAVAGGGFAVTQTVDIHVNQYDDSTGLRIYPTISESGHVHLTTINPEDSLILGDDFGYVRTGSDQDIFIGAGGGEYQIGGHYWIFNNDGNLVLPDGGFITNYDGSVYGGSGSSFDQSLNSTDAVQFAQITIPTGNYAPPRADGTRSLGTKIVVWPEIFVSGHADYAIGIDSGTLWNSVPSAATANYFRWYGGTTKLLELQSNTGRLTNFGEIWTKAGDGVNGLVFSPDGTNTSTYIKVDGGTNTVIGSGSNFYVKRAGSDRLAITDTDSTLSATSNVLIKSSGSTNTWTFDTSGKLRLPSGGDILDSSGTSVLGGSSVDLENIDGNVVVNAENRGFVVDANGDRRVGFMKYSGFEGSFTHANGPTKAIPFRIGRVAADDITKANVDVFTTEVYIGTNGKVRIGDDASNTINDPTYQLEVDGDFMINNSTSGAVTAVLTHGTDTLFQLAAQNGVGNETGDEVARFGLRYDDSNTWNSYTQYVRGGNAEDGHQVLWAAGAPIARIDSDGLTLVNGDLTVGDMSAGNVTISNLTVTGTSTIINTTSYTVSDNIVQFADGNPADTLDLGFIAHRTVDSTLQHTGLIRDASANNWKLFSNVLVQPGDTVDFTDAIYDNLTLGNATATGFYVVDSSASITNVGEFRIWATDTDISIYRNGTDGYGVFGGEVKVFATNDHITSVKQTGLEIKQGSLKFADGSTQTSAYGNANVQAYIGGNIGAYQTYANTQIQTLNANIGAFHTYANATFGVSSYGNTQVAAYLLTWPTANIGTLNSTSGNITTLRATNFSTGNAVISGGYISALTNATITSATLTSSVVTTEVATNFSTANAVITGGYATGLANLTVTGNATIGNLIGTSANTTIVAGSYSSSFLNNGTVAIGGNITASGIAPFYAPNRPAFRVYGTLNTDIAAPTTISSTNGTTVDYNQGSYYNNATGIFTAPAAGLYHCYATLRVGGLNSAIQVMLQKNSSASGSNIIAAWETDTNTGTATHFSMTGYALLVAGDTVRLQVTLGNVRLDSLDSWGVTYTG